MKSVFTTNGAGTHNKNHKRYVINKKCYHGPTKITFKTTAKSYMAELIDHQKT